MIALLGERKVVEQTESVTTSSGTSKAGKSRSITTQVKTESALIKGEVRNLEPLEGILKLSGKMPPARIRIPLSKMKEVAAPFVDVLGLGSIDIERPAGPLPEVVPPVPSVGADLKLRNFNV